MIVAKYKFDKSIYSNFIPVFNDGYNGYTITDVTEGNIVTRTIECDILPTTMIFGEQTGQYENSKIGAKAKSLKEVLYADISSVTYGIYMFGGCINLTKINIESWNNSLTSINCMFFCCKSLVNLDVTSLVGDTVVDIGYAFYYCAKLYNLTGLESWDISNVTYMANMFQNCYELTSIDVSNWDTSNVKNMAAIFANCTKLTSIDVSNWDTSKVTDMWGVFYYCNKLSSLDISNFNTTNVTTMYQMFYNCSNLTSLDVSNFDTSKVTTMTSMFNNCTNLTSLDVSNWDTSNVTHMSDMFRVCSNLTSLDVSNWDTSNVIKMRSMFSGCHSLTSLDVSNWNTSNVTDMCGMFFRCNALTMLDLTNIDAQKAKTDYMCDFLSNDNLKILVLGNKSIHSDINSYGSMLNEESGENPFPLLEKLICPNANYINNLAAYLPDRSSELNSGVIVTNAEISDEAMSTISSKNWSIRKMVAQYKYDANTYENLIPEFNTEFSSDKYEIHDSVSEIVIDNIQWEEGALSTANGLVFNHNERIYTKNYFNVIPNVTYTFLNTTPNVFWYDSDKNFISYDTVKKAVAPSNAKYLRLYIAKGYDEQISAKLITRSIESVNGDLPTLMRFGDSSWENTDVIKQSSLLKVFDYNATNITNAFRVFGHCSNMSLCNVNNVTEQCTSLTQMFHGCDLLTSLDVSNWNISKVNNMQGLFQNCYNLTSLDVSNWDTSNVTTMNYMFSGCNNLTSLDVSNWDTNKVSNMQNMFYSCRSLTSLDVSNFNTSKVTTMQSMFQYCGKLTSLDVSNWDTNKVTNMAHMFEQCNALISVNVASWNLGNVTDISYMFANCVGLLELDVSNWNTEKVTTLYQTFYNCNNLTSLDVSNFDTTNVTNMSYMLYNCKSLTSLDVSNFDTSKVTTMQDMFNGCNNLTSLDVSNWDTSNVTNMYQMFYGCNNLTSLDVSRWNTSKVTRMGSMFWKCKNINYLNLNNWNFDKVVSMICIFGTNVGMKMSLETLDIVNWEISDSTNTKNLFYIDDESLASIKNIRCNNVNVINNVILPNIPTRSSDNKGQIITSAILSQDIVNALASKNWTVVSSNTLTKVAEYVYDSNTWRSMIPTFNDEFTKYFIDDVEDENGLVTRTISSMGELPTTMRFGCDWSGTDNSTNREKSLVSVLDMDLQGLRTAYCMFYRCINLVSVHASSTSNNIVSTANMFQFCLKLSSVVIDKLITSKVADSNSMFYYCNNLTSLVVSNWNTSEVKNMNNMFYYCNNLTSLDVSKWDTSKVTDMSYMFQHCKNLTSLDLSNFNTSNVTNMQYIFSNTLKLLDIGMLYCTPSTINTIASNLPTTHTQTIWVQDTKPSECTVVSGVEFKEYKENSVMINLNSPLLQGDRIEVVDGKLCHYHKMSKIVLDGSENWQLTSAKSAVIRLDSMGVYMAQKNYTNNILCDKLKGVQIIAANSDLGIYMIGDQSTGNYQQIRIRLTLDNIVENVKQWLSENPTTVIYELAEPYYEDITPLQSNIALETYLECNMDIYTNLPIKTNLTYLTNITNTSSIEEEINTINEGTDLTNLLEDEINN